MIGLPPTVFIDRNSGGRIFRGQIEDAGIKVVLHDEYFKDRRTPDHVWLKAIGELGWIMVTCDSATMRDLLFLHSLKRSKARVFILDALEGASADGKAKCVIEAYPKWSPSASGRSRRYFGDLIEPATSLSSTSPTSSDCSGDPENLTRKQAPDSDALLPRFLALLRFAELPLQFRRPQHVLVLAGSAPVNSSTALRISCLSSGLASELGVALL